MKEAYQALLELHKNDNPFSVWQNSPFEAQGKFMATNGSSLVIVPKFEGVTYSDRSDKVSSLYPYKENLSVKITLKKLKDALSKVRLIDCYDDVMKNCDCCDGFGYVDFELDYRFKTYYTEAECPICFGEGEIKEKSSHPNGEKTYDLLYTIKIKNSHFSPLKIEEIINTMNILKADTIILTSQEGEFTRSYFKIGDVDLLVMPVHTSCESIIIKI